MIIAINTRVVSGNAAMANLVETCFEKIAAWHPEHNFFFISNQKTIDKKADSKNITRLVIDQQSAQPLLWKLWYNYKLPALLKKIKADVLVNTDGICSLRTTLPQHLLVNDLAFDHPELYSPAYRKFIKTNQRAFLQKAANVSATSAMLQQRLIKQYGIADAKIQVLYPGADENYKPLNWEEHEQLKEQYSSGKEYFLYAGLVHQQNNLISLLKAFSFFKKRQKSNMQLVIIQQNIDAGFTASLDTYKYRKEVVLLSNLPAADVHKVTAAAYAFVSAASYEDDYTKLLNVMQCRVPLVVGDNELNREMLADAALYAHTNGFEDIAGKMMLLFKDEDSRNQYIEKGIQQAKLFSWQKTAEQLWQNTLAAIQ